MWLRESVKRVVAAFRPEPEQLPMVGCGKLVDNVELMLEVRCPCGSAHPHFLGLHSTKDCARCGRTIAIRSLSYHRQRPDQLPNLEVSIGFVVTERGARNAVPVGGVH